MALFTTPHMISSLFFLNSTSPTEIYTLSLHDALPIYRKVLPGMVSGQPGDLWWWYKEQVKGYAGLSGPSSTNDRVFSCPNEDRKSTRLNSSHTVISYAVFCLKKKKNK